MAAVVFLKTNNLKYTSEFYTSVLGFSPWLSQKNIEILRYDHFLLGLQFSELLPPAPLLGLILPGRNEVDEMYTKLETLGYAEGVPVINLTYDIYGFFAKDVDGRRIEIFSYEIDVPEI